MYTLQPRFWELRIRSLPCGMIFPRPGLGVNKGRDVRGPFDKEQRKDEMSKDLRRIRTERRLPCKGPNRRSPNANHALKVDRFGEFI